MINCIVVDDRQGSIDVIVNHIKKKPELQLLETFTDPLEAMQFVEKNRTDLVFIDMQMPHLSGLDFIESLRVKKGNEIPKFIFTTGHTEYAIPCFEQGVRDYLLKPIGFKRFNIAVDRIILDLKGTSSLGNNNQFFFADVEGAKKKINFKDIAYVESSGNYVKVIGNKLKVLIHKSMNSIQEILPIENFIRVHKSYIISIQHIETYKGPELTFNVNEEIKKIPIGATYKEELIKRLKI
jgi:two-component system LytT family response regulator